MESTINIVTVVDVIEALSTGTLLNGNLCMMDNSPFESQNQGTPDLCTLCQPGQLIKWSIYQVDLQTPVVIKNISFNGVSLANNGNENLDLNVWSGYVPYLTPGVKFKYTMELQMYEGVKSSMILDTPSLMCV